MKITELKDTSALMESPDYKDRFRAEYYQVAIRHEKLKAMLDKWDKGELNFTPTCSRVTYDSQMRAMEDYIAILEERANIEHVEL
ncbi:MAG: crAss001_48 related protein [Oscillospiraceae bacterium]